MSDEEDVFLIDPENLNIVLTEFLKIFRVNVYLYMSIDEIIDVFKAEYGMNDEGAYQITESDLKLFFEKINGIVVDRLMVDMDRKGLADLGYGNNGLCLIAKK
jgi:hypothetical protein